MASIVEQMLRKNRADDLEAKLIDEAIKYSRVKAKHVITIEEKLASKKEEEKKLEEKT